jgi:hypothetical protein
VRLARAGDDTCSIAASRSASPMATLLCSVVDAQWWPALAIDGVVPGRKYAVAADRVLSVVKPQRPDLPRSRMRRPRESRHHTEAPAALARRGEDAPVVLLDDASADRQPNPLPLSSAPGAVKRTKRSKRRWRCVSVRPRPSSSTLIRHTPSFTAECSVIRPPGG